MEGRSAGKQSRRDSASLPRASGSLSSSREMFQKLPAVWWFAEAILAQDDLVFADSSLFALCVLLVTRSSLSSLTISLFQ